MHSIIYSTINRAHSLLKKDIFKDLSVYTVLGFVQKAFPFLLLPVLTRILTPSDYGIIAMFATAKSFFGPFPGLGSVSAVERYYFDRHEINFPVFISNILLIIFSTTIFFGTLMLLFGHQISIITKIPGSFLWIVIIVTFGITINRINLSLFRVQNKSLSFAALSLLETGLYFLLMLLFVAGLGFNWKADFYSQLIVYSLLIFTGLWLLKKSNLINFKFNSGYLKSALTFGIPMFVHTFGLFFVNMTDKLFITRFIGIDATGIYNIGFKMATILVFFVTAFNNAYVPWLYGKLKVNTRSSFRKAFKSTLYSALFVVFIGGLIFMLMPLIYPILIGEKFASSINVSKIILIGEIFNAFYLLLMSYILFQKATKYIMYITISTSIISVSLNLLLIPHFGIIGAAYVLMAVYFIKFALTILFTIKLYIKGPVIS
jgi:O-antigen/teichoic acid export membrane protein